VEKDLLIVLVSFQVSHDGLEKLLLPLWIISECLTPAQRWLQFKHKVTKVLNIHVACCIWVKRTPSVLKYAKHVTVHFLIFLISCVNITEKDNCHK
jgi:hypothetical protein